jgi:superfamily II DNA or RNA helicase
MRSRLLPAGLLKYVKHFADTRAYSIQIDQVSHTPSFDLLSKIPLTSGGKSIEPRDYQLEAVRKAITDKTALLVSPTASGKSLIIYLMIRWFLANHQSKVLVVVPTTSLVEQMSADFIDYATTELPDIGNHIHKIYSGKEKDDMRTFVLTLDNGDTLKLSSSTKVKLTNGTTKVASALTTRDDICDKWLHKLKNQM